MLTLRDRKRTESLKMDREKGDREIGDVVDRVRPFLVVGTSGKLINMPKFLFP